MKRVLLFLVLWAGLISSALAQGGFGPGPGTVHSTGGGGGGTATCPNAGPLGGSWTLVNCIQLTGGSGTGGTTSPAIDCLTGGTNLIVFVVARYGDSAGAGSPSVITDNSSNNYAPRVLSQSGGSAQYDIVSFDSLGFTPTITTSMTFTITYGVSNFPALEVLCIKDASGTPTFHVGASSNNQSSAASLATGSLTPAGNGRLLVSGITTGNVSPTASATVNSSFIYAAGGPLSANVEGGSAVFYQATAAAINPTWSFPAVAGSAAFIMDYAP